MFVDAAVRLKAKTGIKAFSSNVFLFVTEFQLLCIGLLPEPLDQPLHRSTTIAAPLIALINHEAEKPVGSFLGAALAHQQKADRLIPLIDGKRSPGWIELRLRYREYIGGDKRALVGCHV